MPTFPPLHQPTSPHPSRALEVALSGCRRAADGSDPIPRDCPVAADGARIVGLPRIGPASTCSLCHVPVRDHVPGTEDATLFSSQPNTNHGGTTTVGVDGDQVLHVLTVFRDIFGASAGQVPTGSTINTATLTLRMVASPSEAVNLHRMLRDA